MCSKEPSQWDGETVLLSTKKKTSTYILTVKLEDWMSKTHSNRDAWHRGFFIMKPSYTWSLSCSYYDVKRTIIVRIWIFISIVPKISESLKAKKSFSSFLWADDESCSVELSPEQFYNPGPGTLSLYLLIGYTLGSIKFGQYLWMGNYFEKALEKVQCFRVAVL